MPSKKTFPYNGQQVQGEAVAVTDASEPWATYTLEDGTRVKAKLVLLEVVRLDAHNPATGDPVYQFQFQQIIGADTPDSLKKKAN